jgi:DNA replication protein DnaC
MEKEDLYELVCLPAKYQAARLSKVPEECPHYKLIHEWVYNIKDKVGGPGLYLYGDLRRGKSSCAAIIQKAAMANGIITLWITYRRLHEYAINKEEHMFDSYLTMIDRIRSVDLLIIDEVEVKENKKWTVEVLEDIVRDRYQQKKTTILTSNQSPDLLRNSRTIAPICASLTAVMKECAKPVKVEGKDFSDDFKAR